MSIWSRMKSFRDRDRGSSGCKKGIEILDFSIHRLLGGRGRGELRAFLMIVGGGAQSIMMLGGSLLIILLTSFPYMGPLIWQRF